MSSIRFVIDYPGSLWLMLQIGVLQVVGQLSIYYIVSHFKQHIFPLISTTRKILTVIMSIFVFGHYINQWQWVAIAIVFFGMFYEFWEELRHQQHKDHKHELKAHKKQQA